MDVKWMILALALGSAACKGEVAGGAADGAKVFQEACARCHGEGGTPPEQLRTTLGVKDLAAAEFQGRATLEAVRAQVQNGSTNKVMPGFGGALSAAQIDAVSAYVLTLDGP